MEKQPTDIMISKTVGIRPFGYSGEDRTYQVFNMAGWVSMTEYSQDLARVEAQAWIDEKKQIN